MALEQDQRNSEVVTREHSGVRTFIRRRLPAPRDAEDILQDVFYKLVEANRLLMPIEHLTGWLFSVARTRITDLLGKEERTSVSIWSFCCRRPARDRRRFTPAACFSTRSSRQCMSCRRNNAKCLSRT